MAILNDSKLLERTLITLVIVALCSFAYYFTQADLDEVSSRYANRRIVLVKLLAKEVIELLDRKIDLTPRLSNLLSEEAVAYSFVQQPNGDVIARAENYSVAVGVLETIEEKALKAVHMELIPFMDTSRTIPLVETVIPLVTSHGKKVVLRVGFFKDSEEKRLRQVQFRNTLIFSLFMLGLFTYWLIRHHHASNIHHTLLGGTAIAILLLFLASRMTLQSWYEIHWGQNFVRQGLYLSKMFKPAAFRFVETGEEKDLKAMYDLVAESDDFSYVSVIKDDRQIYHSDPTQLGEGIADSVNYRRSLNSDKPIIFKIDEQNLYEAFIPLIDGQHRLGTLKTVFRSNNPQEPLIIMRDKLVLLFVVALLVLLLFMHLLSRRISKEVSWFIKAMDQVTAGDLRQHIYIKRNDEFGQMAHAFNFMIMSMKERDLIGKGLQQYVSRSIVDKTLKALSGFEKNGEKVFTITVFVYFSGIDEAMEKVEGTQIFNAVQETFSCVRKVCPPSKNISLQLIPSGILVLYNSNNRQDAILKALNSARLIARDLGYKSDLPFSPKVTIHTLEMVRGAISDDEYSSSLFGDGFIDFRTLSKVQDGDEVIASRKVYGLLKDVMAFDELEILSGDQGKLSTFVVREYKSPRDLIDSFSSATAWTKIMILKILRSNTEPWEAKTLFGWFEDEEPQVRYEILATLSCLKPNGLLDFVVGCIAKEQEAKVLSKALSVLGAVGNEEHIPVIAEKLRSDDRRVKANAVEALEAIGGKKVYEFLNLLVDEKDNRVKANILIALGKYGDLKVFDLLGKMLRDSDKNMRASAAFALGKLGMAQGVEPLVNALADKDPDVKRQVVASLTSLKADLDIEI